MGLIGLYVGIIPIAVGMLWLPWMRQLDKRWLRFLLALTIGLLVFLGIDAAIEGLDLGASGAESLGGGALMWLGAALAYLALVAVDGLLSRRGRGGEHVALLVAIGIGLHNLGEGLVIGSAYAVGSLALGAALVVGFAIHNTTEGLAIVAPVAERPPRHRAPRAARPDRRCAGHPRSLDRRIRFRSEPGRIHVRCRCGRDRPRGRPDRAAGPRQRGALSPPARGRRAGRGARPHVRDKPADLGMTMETEASHAVQDYAKAIYSLSRRGSETVATSALADRLAVSPASASAMAKRLAELGLVTHEPYHGVRLTESGEKLALEVIRHHRLIELYLSEALGMPWDRVHDEAEVLEHAISEELSELIAEKLGDPTHDPHGDPIPTRDGRIEEGATRSLAESEPGERVVLTRVSDSDPAMLRYLGERGIEPGTRLEVIGREPFGGPLNVRVGRHELPLGLGLARAMRVSESALGASR